MSFKRRSGARAVAKAASLLPILAVAWPMAGGMAAPRRAADSPPPASQSLHEAVALAWERLPQRQSLAARQATARAQYAAGGALLPNAPSFNGSYVNDKVAGSNYNYLTAQAGLSTPVWLPGEGTATQRLAQAGGAVAAADTEAAHLAVAAQVVDAAAQALLAANARDVATRRLQADRALAAALARQFQVGEASESDSLVASAEAASADASLQGAEAQLAAARLAIAVLTGTDLVPRLDLAGPAAPESAGADVVEANPRVMAALRAVEAARANAKLVRIADRDDPEVGFVGINEKQPGTRWDTRFGVTATFHFATEARNAPRRAEAEQRLTEAEVQLVAIRREVGAGLKQAEALLAGFERGSAAAVRAASALEKRRGQVERAWRAGEMPLIEVVRANAVAFDSAFARDKAQTDLAAARLRLRLAGGMLP